MEQSQLVTEQKDFVVALEKKWVASRRNPEIKDELVRYWEKLEDPYLGTLNICLFTCDFRAGKTNTLPAFILKEFETWIRPVVCSYINLLTHEIKVRKF